jgi:8-oxo-dGTP pyrophosphatase MutT (NUDIX family)
VSACAPERRWLVASAPELAPVPDLAVARLSIERYVPRDDPQARARAFVLEWIDAHPDALLRSCLGGHLTSSALVLDAAGERALLTLHAKLGRWLQLGGHCDGDANLAGSALRECREESGIAGLAIDPVPIDLDCHRIPARADEPEHWHLDARFLVRAPPGAAVLLSAESTALRWFAPGELDALATDDSVRRLFELAFGSSTHPGG